MADYGFSKTIDVPYEAAIERVTAALKEEGFGVLTAIDVKETLKKKLDVDFRKYVILGACNPPLAHQALTEEPGLGLLLPCNVVVTEDGDGSVFVSAVDPVQMFKVVERSALEPIAQEVKGKLGRALAAIGEGAEQAPPRLAGTP